jgi:hypothetical protein
MTTIDSIWDVTITRITRGAEIFQVIEWLENIKTTIWAHNDFMISGIEQIIKILKGGN